jgi:hypothetical protein
MTLLKTTTCFGLYYLRPSSGGVYPFIKENCTMLIVYTHCTVFLEKKDIYDLKMA